MRRAAALAAEHRVLSRRDLLLSRRLVVAISHSLDRRLSLGKACAVAADTHMSGLSRSNGERNGRDSGNPEQLLEHVIFLFFLTQTRRHLPESAEPLCAKLSHPPE